MSEDKTEIAGNTDTTEVLEVQKAPTTQPMLKEILEGMREGFAEMREGLAKVNSRLDTVEKDIKEIKRNQNVLYRQILSI